MLAWFDKSVAHLSVGCASFKEGSGSMRRSEVNVRFVSTRENKNLA